MAGADLALEDAGGVGVGAHGTGMTVNGAAAVGHGSAVSVPALDDAGVALSFGNAGDVHMVAGVEHIGFQLVADIHGCTRFQFEFLKHFL
ncbi:hypothetical protein SDC9_122181 [bioreactor metagenome]|uniref:Uncharacterized protein n=1 Tax=bioreactor metagenome TaxID=1076179 RepID=A0A645CE61_9ZZZZ